MDDLWYYLQVGEERGPLAFEDLLGVLRASPAPYQVYVWRDGMAQWLPAGSVPEIRARLDALPPPPRPIPQPGASYVQASGTLYTPPPQNPYALPQAANSGSAGRSPVQDAEEIAKQYRRLVGLVGLQLLLGCLVRIPLEGAVASGGEAAMAVSVIYLLVMLVVLVITVLMIGSAYRLARALGEGVPVLWAVAMFLPCINILVLLVLSSKAQSWCRRYGVKVGLLGPTKESIEELKQRKWGSEFD